LDLIDITLKPDSALDEAALMSSISALIADAELDNHRQWQRAMQRWVLFVQAVAGLILLVALGCMAAVISLAAYASMDVNRHSVSIFHVIGAEDRFIVRAFRRYFLRLGLVAGLVGAAGAALTFFVAEQLVQFIPYSLKLSAIGVSLTAIDYAALALIPTLACCVAITASRRQVLLHLRELS